jgi:uncharacterized LabA/DUF88 family protein
MRDEVKFSSDKLAVLIDAENASANLIEPLLGEVAKYGTAYVKRIYGDWTSLQLSGWKDKLHRLAIQPIQQFRYTTGKNSTDSALIIDAMDLLYTQNFDGFCIVSSDSDFTPLASRIRESGLVVYGFGEKKTPEAFVRACDKFIYCEILEQSEASAVANPVESFFKEQDKHSSQASSVDLMENVDRQNLKTNKKLSKLLRDAYEAIAGEDGWANLGPFGAQLTKLSPSFDSRNYGYKKLGELVRAIEMFEVRETLHGKRSAAKELHIKLKS